MSFIATARTSIIGTTMGLAALVAASNSTLAGPTINIEVDDARLVALAGRATTVVVSNPMFADASIEGNKLVLIGKNTGRTKVIVLDNNGDQLANVMVKVQRAETEVVSVYKGGNRYTMNCEPFCDQPLTVNDEQTRYKEQSEQIILKTGTSTGAASTGAGSAQ